jgi:hypothetical protein
MHCLAEGVHDVLNEEIGARGSMPHPMP